MISYEIVEEYSRLPSWTAGFSVNGPSVTRVSADELVGPGGRGYDPPSEARSIPGAPDHGMSMMKAIKRRITTAILLVFAGGCGYTTDRSAAMRMTNSKNERIRTVALDIFESKEFRRGLELQLTEALAKRIESETPFKLVKKDRADSVLSGEVREVRQSTIGRDFADARPRETTATVVISFQWKDLRTGEVLLDRPNFVQTVDYIRPLGEDFYHASQRMMDRLAERMIEEMGTTDW